MVMESGRHYLSARVSRRNDRLLFLCVSSDRWISWVPLKWKRIGFGLVFYFFVFWRFFLFFFYRCASIWAPERPKWQRRAASASTTCAGTTCASTARTPTSPWPSTASTRPSQYQSPCFLGFFALPPWPWLATVSLSLYWVSLRFNCDLNRVLPGFTGFYRVLPGFTGFYRVLLGFTGFFPGACGHCDVGPTVTQRPVNVSSRTSILIERLFGSCEWRVIKKKAIIIDCTISIDRLLTSICGWCFEGLGHLTERGSREFYRVLPSFFLPQGVIPLLGNRIFNDCETLEKLGKAFNSCHCTKEN